MGKRMPWTPSSQIRSALRVLWLRSRERSAALRSTNNCCAYCGVKQSVAKGKECRLAVHHMDHVPWDDLLKQIRDKLLQTPDRLAPCCKSCHDKIHAEEKANV